MRISGLGSGMDVDAMVQEMMQARRKPLDKLFQQKTIIEWQREQYREMNIKLVDFANNKLLNYGLSSSIAAKSTSLSGNTTAVTAKATAGAVAGSLKVEVTQLAEAASLRTSDAAAKGIAMNDATAVSSSMLLKDLVANSNLTYTNEAGQNGPKISVTVTTNGVASTKEIQLDENVDTLASVLSKINSETGATAVFDNTSGKLSLTSKSMGENTTVTVGGEFFDALQMTQSTVGKNALATVNGLAVSSASNKMTINGVELNFNSVSNGVATTIAVASDTDKIMDTLKSFIKDYNEVLGLLNNKTDEQRYRKFTPLTTEQRKEMDEDEIKMWDAKAKSGLLRRDSILEPIVSNMRLASMTSVNVAGVNVNLTALGITTGSYTDGGKLVISDEKKLREAIESNPEQVMGLFAQNSTNKSPTAADAGLFRRLTNIITTSLTELSKKAGTSRFSIDPNTAWMENSSMAGQIQSLDKRMSDVNRRLALAENNYYRQFTAMETALSRFNSQSSVFSNFGS